GHRWLNIHLSYDKWGQGIGDVHWFEFSDKQFFWDMHRIHGIRVFAWRRTINRKTHERFLLLDTDGVGANWSRFRYEICGKKAYFYETKDEKGFVSGKTTREI